MFSTPFPNAFGLDIGDLSIKAVQLRRVPKLGSGEGSYDLIAARATQLPPGLIVNGELEQPEKVRRYLQHVLAGDHNGQPAIKSPWAVASLPERQGFMKLIDINKSYDDIIEDDIMFAATQHIPMPIDDLYINWQIFPSMTADSVTKVMIGAMPRRIVDSYTYLLESVGLGVVALEHEVIATMRSIFGPYALPDNEAVAVIDIGATQSHIVVCDHNMAQFTMPLLYTGEGLTQALSHELNISSDAAEQQKRKYGLMYQQQKGLWDILMRETDRLAASIQQSFDFYYSHFHKANRIRKLLVCGGTARLQYLDDVLTNKLNVPVEMGNPWSHVRINKGQVGHLYGSDFAAGVGLAMRAAENPFFVQEDITAEKQTE